MVVAAACRRWVAGPWGYAQVQPLPIIWAIIRTPPCVSRVAPPPCVRHLGRAHSGGLGSDLALTAAGSGANTATAPPPLPSAGLADLRSPDPLEEAESSSPAAPTTASSTHRSIHEIVLCFAFTFACFYRFPSWSVCTWLLQRRQGCCGAGTAHVRIQSV
ncbi:hypothetical protein ACP70R_048628 [Stipagrostis hirtigluma subsp. patula]